MGKQPTAISLVRAVPSVRSVKLPEITTTKEAVCYFFHSYPVSSGEIRKCHEACTYEKSHACSSDIPNKGQSAPRYNGHRAEVHTFPQLLSASKSNRNPSDDVYCF